MRIYCCVTQLITTILSGQWIHFLMLILCESSPVDINIKDTIGRNCYLWLAPLSVFFRDFIVLWHRYNTITAIKSKTLVNASDIAGDNLHFTHSFRSPATAIRDKNIGAMKVKLIAIHCPPVVTRNAIIISLICAPGYDFQHLFNIPINSVFGLSVPNIIHSTWTFAKVTIR